MMRAMTVMIVLSALVLVPLVNGAVVVVDGSPNGNVIQAAPGQVITFHIQGIGQNVKDSIYATSLPLPTVLGGISAQLTQFPPSSSPVPIFSIQKLAPCWEGAVSPGCDSSYAAVTVQLPTTGFQAQVRGVLVGVPIPPALLQFSENGAIVASVTVSLFSDQIKVCNNSEYDSSRLYSMLSLDACGPGNLRLGPQKTFKSGQEYVVYVFGLGGGGYPDFAGKSPGPNDKFGMKPQVVFDARTNAGPSNPTNYITGLRDPASWGPVVGYPGLYQVRVILPELPLGAPNCFGGTNLTISVVGPSSYDGDRICMENAVQEFLDPPAITGVINSTTGQKCDLTANSNCTITAGQLDTLELYGLRFNANGGNLVRMFSGTSASDSSYLYSGDGYYFWDGHGNSTRINAQIGCGIPPGDLRLAVWRDSVHQSANSAPVKVTTSGKCP
jgi:hypothetical protein